MLKNSLWGNQDFIKFDECVMNLRKVFWLGLLVLQEGLVMYLPKIKKCLLLCLQHTAVCYFLFRELEALRGHNLQKFQSDIRPVIWGTAYCECPSLSQGMQTSCWLLNMPSTMNLGRAKYSRESTLVWTSIDINWCYSLAILYSLFLYIYFFFLIHR